MRRIYRTTSGVVAELGGRFFRLDRTDWDELFCAPDVGQAIAEAVRNAGASAERPIDADLLPPILGQEVWAAGVTYLRSRAARMEESRDASNFYDLVYDAPRPELFFKATPHRVVGHAQAVRIRRDSAWNVPEPELTLCISPAGRIFGYTIGNDMSSRDIEGENPLYLPQAKVYEGSCSLGPGILVRDEPLPPGTEIRLDIQRGGAVVFEQSTRLDRMKRSPEELVEFLFRDNSFPKGCFLLTGTGIIPPSQFTLQSGDRIRITIEPIGMLENTVS
jgi:2-dehydro-3-deoxy-D-arabinonate dehydratase